MSTKIEWTTETWNPVSGCSKVSPGCKNCYAIKDAHRLAGNPNPKIAAKYEGTTKIENGKMNWTGRINLASDDVLTQPIRWTRPRKIFVNSMSDLFHENVPDEWIDKIFAVMALSPQHTFQILTKRAERMKDYFRNEGRNNLVNCWARSSASMLGKEVGQLQFEIVNNKYYGIDTAHLKNVWLGVSVENQKAADERIPHLLDTPAAVRFLSCEPLLENINFTLSGLKTWDEDWRYDVLSGNEFSSPRDYNESASNKIDWVIVGGESGSGARPVHPDWIRSIRDQCVAANVKFFFKQWGNWFPLVEKPADDGDWSIGKDKAVSHTYLWNDDDENISVNIGKHNAGRCLDGRTWDEYPE